MSGKKVIKDPVLDPYVIMVDSNSFDVYELKIKEKTGKEIKSPTGYFNSLESAVSKIAKLKVNTSPINEFMLSEYIKEIKKANQDIVKAIGGL